MRPRRHERKLEAAVVPGARRESSVEEHRHVGGTRFVRVAPPVVVGVVEDEAADHARTRSRRAAQRSHRRPRVVLVAHGDEDRAVARHRQHGFDRHHRRDGREGLRVAAIVVVARHQRPARRHAPHQAEVREGGRGARRLALHAPAHVALEREVVGEVDAAERRQAATRGAHAGVGLAGERERCAQAQSHLCGPRVVDGQLLAALRALRRDHVHLQARRAVRALLVDESVDRARVRIPVTQRPAAAHAQRSIRLVAHVAGGEGAAHAAAADRAHAVQAQGPVPLLARVVDAVVAAEEVAVDGDVSPRHVGLEAEHAEVLAIAPDARLAVEPCAEVVASLVRLAVDEVELHAIVAARPREGSVDRARGGLRWRTAAVAAHGHVARIGHLDADLCLRRRSPLRSRGEELAAQAREARESQPVVGAGRAVARLQLQVAVADPLGVDAGDRKGGNEESVLRSRELDARRVQHAQGVVGDPAVVEGQAALPQRDDVRGAAVADGRIEAEGAVLESLEAAAQDHAVLVADRAALVDAARESLEAPFARQARGVVLRLARLGAERLEIPGIDQAVFVLRARRFSGATDRGREDACAKKNAQASRIHFAKLCSNGVDLLSPHSSLPRMVIG